MSSSLNRVQLIGRLEKKPDLSMTSSGTNVCNFYLDTTREWVNREGEEKSESVWHRCVAWARLAEICHELLNERDLVYVEGRIGVQKFTRDDGSDFDEMVIVVSEMILLERNYED